MRRLLLLAAAIFVSGAGKPESSPTSELRFAPDYVPNYAKVVPQAIRSCGASFIGLKAQTEGVESAFFGVGPDRERIVTNCIQRQLPQVHVAQPLDHCLMPSCMPDLIQAPPVPANLRTPAPGDPATLRYELRFGATLTSPIGPPVPCANPTPGHELCPYREPDYIPDYETAVPQAIRSCGASFIAFRPLTEGAEVATFDVDPARAPVVVDCVKQRLPQGHVGAATNLHS